MKRSLFIFILCLSFQTLTKADDIRDFEIAGISIGDSVLEFMTKNEINDNKTYVYKNKKYTIVYKELDNESYDGVQLEFRDNDDRYLIKSFAGKIFYNNKDMNDCYEQEKVVIKELKKLFKNKSQYTNHGTSPHPADATGKSKGTWHTFVLDDDTGHISIECTDWTEEMIYHDNLKVSIISSEMNQFLLNEAYK